MDYGIVNAPLGARGASHTRHRRLLAGTALAVAILTSHASAQGVQLPSGGHVTAGQANIGQSGASTVITQSSAKAIINWTDFSIGQGGTVQFDNGAGATLNRVTGANLSSIDGLLSATGSVFLINPNGVIIGKSGVVTTGGSFVASALDLDDAAFLKGGDLTFDGASTAAVVNLGKVGALGGDVALVAAHVENQGTLEAANGAVGLLAGHRVLMRDQSLDGGKFAVLVGGADTSATNTGAIRAAAVELRAEGGNIYAMAGNTKGVINATGVTSKDGRVFLTAGDGGSVTVSGTRIAASTAAGDGGAISITGKTVEVAPDAVLDASATSATGQGGRIGVVADMTSGALTFAGTALARGGRAAGNGGSVETSGAHVDFDGATVDTSAGHGTTGTWLTDPYDLSIDTTAAQTLQTNLATTSVTLQTTATGASPIGTANAAGVGDITVNAPITWSSANTLTLDAYRGVNINGALTVAGAGKVVLKTNDGGTGGDYVFGANDALSFTGPANAGQGLSINGTTYTLLYSLSDLASTSFASGHFALAQSLDAGGLTYLAPVTNTIAFGSVLEGLGHTVSDLTIKSSFTGAGLISFNDGTVRDIGLIGASVSGTATVGALIGENNGTLSHAYATGTVTGTSAVGGLVGLNDGSIAVAYATVAVNGASQVGGLVGYDEDGQINQAYAGGSVTATTDAAGGLVGELDHGTVSQAYATGAVTGPADAGGLVGLNAGGTVAGGYYDSQTSGQADTGKGVALTTAQLQSGTLPAGFDPTVWGGAAGYFPYLVTLTNINTQQKISGYALTSGGTATANATLGVYAGGSLLGGGTATSGADGYYYILVAPSLASSSTPLGVTETLAGALAISGASVTDTPVLSAGNVVNLNVQSGLFGYTTGASSSSALAASAAAAFGASRYAALRTTLSWAATQIVAANAFDIDSALSSGGTVTVQSGGDLTLAATGSVTSTASGTAVVLAANGSLINDAGANAVSAANGRWLIYTQGRNAATQAAAANVFGGLAGSSYYGDAYSFTTGAFATTPNAGNRFVTGYQPPLLVLATTTSKTYDGAAQTDTYTATGYINAADAAKDVLTGTVTGLTTSSKNVGTYSLLPTGTLASDENYAIWYGAGTLTITPASLTLAAMTDTKIYDATTTSTQSVSVQGLQGTGDTVTATQSFGSANVLGANASLLSVNGGYVVNDGNSGKNYVVTTKTASGTITPKALTISGTTVANKTYDGKTSDTAVAGKISGLIGKQTLTTTVASAAFATANAGTQAVSVTYALGNGANGGLAGNYSLASSLLSATINKATLTYVATPTTAGTLNILLGQKPTLTGKVTGFVDGETLATATTGKLTWSTNFGLPPYGAGILPGAYAIDGGGLSARNYTFVQAAGNAKALSVQLLSLKELMSPGNGCGIFGCYGGFF